MRSTMTRILFCSALWLIGTTWALCEPSAPKREASSTQKTPVRIAIVLPLQHQALNEIVEGFQETLKENYPQPERLQFTVKNAQGDLNIQKAILQDFKQKEWDLVVPISTGTAQMTVHMIQGPPILAVAASMAEPSRSKKPAQAQTTRRMTALSDEIPVKQSLQFMQKMLPELKRLTVIHSTDPHVIKQVNELKSLAQDMALTVQTLMVQQLPDLYTLTQRIDPKSQIVFVLKDNTVVSGITTLVKHTAALGIPLMTSDDGSVQKGASFALGVSEIAIGQRAAHLALKILTGTPIHTIPFESLEHPSVFANAFYLEKQAFSLRYLEKTCQSMGYALTYVDRHAQAAED